MELAGCFRGDGVDGEVFGRSGSYVVLTCVPALTSSHFRVGAPRLPLVCNLHVRPTPLTSHLHSETHFKPRERSEAGTLCIPGCRTSF